MPQPLPVTVFLGGPPALILAAIAPLPEDVPELVLASLLAGEKLKMTKDPFGGHRLAAEAEFALVGFARPAWKLRHDELPRDVDMLFEGSEHFLTRRSPNPLPSVHRQAELHRFDSLSKRMRLDRECFLKDNRCSSVAIRLNQDRSRPLLQRAYDNCCNSSEKWLALEQDPPF